MIPISVTYTRTYDGLSGASVVFTSKVLLFYSGIICFMDEDVVLK